MRTKKFKLPKDFEGEVQIRLGRHTIKISIDKEEQETAPEARAFADQAERGCQMVCIRQHPVTRKCVSYRKICMK